MSTRAQLLFLDDGALLAQCVMDTFRASGAGGQKRNKTSNAVRLRHLATGIAGQGTESRSQHVNRMRALNRLREALALDHREPVAADYEPSDLLRQAFASGPRPVGGRSRYDSKYLLALGELLDVFAACGAQVGESSRRLGVTTSLLTSLLCGDERVFRRVLEMRAQHGLTPLRGT